MVPEPKDSDWLPQTSLDTAFRARRRLISIIFHDMKACSEKHNQGQGEGGACAAADSLVLVLPLSPGPLAPCCVAGALKPFPRGRQPFHLWKRPHRARAKRPAAPSSHLEAEKIDSERERERGRGVRDLLVGV